MKQLTIVRHAKSDWGKESLYDIDRHLNEKGYTDAYACSEWCKKNNAIPDVIFSSTATRAISTALIFSRTLNIDEKSIFLRSRFYEADLAYFFESIKNCDDTFHHIIYFGHNPFVTEVCNILNGKKSLDEIPTCGMVSFKFDNQCWHEINLTNGKMEFKIFPKSLC